MHCDLLRKLLTILLYGFAYILLLYLGMAFTIIPYSIVEVALETPRIARAYNYVPASMIIREIRLSHGYCCNLVCFCDEVEDAKAEQCGSMQNRTEALSPSQCDSAHFNSSSALCPPTGAAAVCNNGFFCCSSCDGTCTSKAQPECNCPCKHCSTCSCCKQVEGRLCRLFCDPCDKVQMNLEFKDREGKTNALNMARNYSLESAEAQEFYDTHPVNSSFLAFYKPSDHTSVHMSRGYAVRKWAEYVILTACPLFLMMVMITGLLITCLLEKWGQFRIEKVVIMNWVLWVGIMWPFVILLPILEVGNPTPHAKTGLLVFIPLIASIGWLPLALLWCLPRVP